MNTSEKNVTAAQTELLDLNVEEISVVDLDDRLELAFRCDSSAKSE